MAATTGTCHAGRTIDLGQAPTFVHLDDAGTVCEHGRYVTDYERECAATPQDTSVRSRTAPNHTVGWHTAACSCGWTGQGRVFEATARTDADSHARFPSGSTD